MKETASLQHRTFRFKISGSCPLLALAGIERLKTMRTMDDRELLETYTRDRSEAAFSELVQRHLSWVYSVALRHVGDSSLAEEVAQSVFVLLARKAGSLRSGTILGGWLFRTTRFVANRAVRAEKRRRSREQTAASMTSTVSSPDDNEALWVQVAPHLDQAVAALSETDRAAIILRFYEKKTLLEIGQRLGLSEEAAKKRVSRAVDKLRTLLGQHGVALGAVVLAGILVQNTVQAAPASLMASAAGASGSATLPALARETLSAWRSAQIKLVSGLAAASLCLIFVAGIASGRFNRHATTQTAVARGSLPAQTGAEKAEVAETASAPASPAVTNAPVKTGAITGLVLDDQGRPVVGAMVWEGNCSHPNAQDTTDGSGRFALNEAEARNLPFLGDLPFMGRLIKHAAVTVTADGFAADQQEIDVTNTAQLVFRLSPILPLFVRIVDEAGEPISDGNFFMSTWWGRPGTLAQHLPQKTDADGRLQWLSAPKGELVVEFGKTGYRFSRTNRMTADGTEHLIVLHPSVTVTGNVTDADTGAPIDNFQLTAGHSQQWIPDDPTPYWDMHGQTCTKGVYRMVIDEEQTPYIRIESPGYDTIETKVQLTNATESVFNVQLKRQSVENSIRGIVLLPDGSPAAEIQVALCTAQSGVVLNGTAFEPVTFGNIPKSRLGQYQKRTDEQGKFVFEPKPGAHTVVAVGESGLGLARCFDFSKPLEIRLKPWGRVTGTVQTLNGQRAGRTVSWEFPGNLTSWATLEYDTKRFTTTSDEVGRFTLEHLPPGDGRISVSDFGHATPVLSRLVHVEPGENVEVQVGGIGRPVTGKLVAPPGVEIRSWTNQVTLARLCAEWSPYNMPEDLTGNAIERWKIEFEDTEVGRAWSRNQYSYNFRPLADGSFTIPEVLPGKYRLFINVAQGYLGSGQPSGPSYPGDHVIASTGIAVTVPEGNTESPLDLGEIVLIGD
jgi:RNA polymerase sigma factor (sigma-70 family)